MKSEWRTKTLEEVCVFLNGLWKGENPPFVNIGVIRNTNFTKDGDLDDTDIAYLDVEAKKLDKRRLQFGDIILEKSGGGPKQPVGRVALFDKNEGTYSFSNFTAALRVRNPDEIDFRFLHKYLYWTYLSGVTEGMQSHSTGIRNLDGNAYKTIKFSFPLLSEQLRIAGILDKAFEGIAIAKANAEKDLQNARALFESYLQAAFTQCGEGWTEKKFGDLAEFRNGINFTKSSEGESIKIIGVKDFQNSYWAPLDNLDIVTTDGAIPLANLLRENDFLFVRSNGNMKLIGRCLLVRAISERITHSGFTIRARLNAGSVIPKYLCHFFKSNKVRQQMINSGIGTNIKSLNQGALSELVIPLPTIAEQKKIVHKLDLVSIEAQRLEAIYRHKIAELGELKKSLLHQAFNGNL